MMIDYQKFLPFIERNYFISHNPMKIIEHKVSESGKKKEDIQSWMEQNSEEIYKNNL